MIIETISVTGKPDKSQTRWEVVTEAEKENETSSTVVWEVLEAGDESSVFPSTTDSSVTITPPTNPEEAEIIFKTIPLQPSDYKSLINLSFAVPTALVLSPEDWRLTSSTISPFQYADGTGNQNYAIQIDYGLSNRLQISGFYSEADDPLNTKSTGLKIRPANFWEVFGAAVRWQFLVNNDWSLALNSSLESWTVGSGGSDSFGRNSADNASPNIFNDSGKRVETQNLVGSISLPLTLHAKKAWQFTLAPSISFLPSEQGHGQGGAGEFYGTNPYISGGLLWHPTAEIGVTASIAQPFGSGANNFDRNLKYTRVPIFSGGLNWHLNPRIALQGQLTNGFGATPATGLLTLPSDNRLGYSASFIFTADAPDAHSSLSPLQRSLSLGGLTVNTAIVPPDGTSITKIGADREGSFSTTLGYSISNIFHLDFYRSENKNIPQVSAQARAFTNDNSESWRGSGTAILTSPLRGSPIWSALRISFGRSLDNVNSTANGYLFAETPLTWEVNSKTAININPKVAWSGIGTLWGIGLGAIIQIAPNWELVPEANFVLNSSRESNSTLGLRWNVFDDVAVEVYGSTASSVIDIGQLLDADQIRWGGRLVIKL